MRKLLIAANWKMYKTPKQAESFLQTFLPLVKDHKKGEIVICPPSIDLTFALQSVEGSDVLIGAQNMHSAEEGAYTGEISAGMLTAPGGEACDSGPLGAASVFRGDRRQREPETRDSAQASHGSDRLRGGARGTAGERPDRRGHLPADSWRNLPDRCGQIAFHGGRL